MRFNNYNKYYCRNNLPGFTTHKFDGYNYRLSKFRKTKQRRPTMQYKSTRAIVKHNKDQIVNERKIKQSISCSNPRRDRTITRNVKQHSSATTNNGIVHCHGLSD